MFFWIGPHLLKTLIIVLLGLLRLHWLVIECCSMFEEILLNPPFPFLFSSIYKNQLFIENKTKEYTGNQRKSIQKKGYFTFSFLFFWLCCGLFWSSGLKGSIKNFHGVERFGEELCNRSNSFVGVCACLLCNCNFSFIFLDWPLH